MKRYIPKVRRRIQRAFFTWFDEAGPRFKIPIRIEKRTNRRVDFSFTGIPNVLRGTLYREEVMVFAEWEGEFWDILLDLEVYPVKKAGRFICSECPPEAQTAFPSREALWQDHLFEPLLEWVNTKLAIAKALRLYATTTKGATWAKLFLLETSEDKEADYLIAKVAFATHRVD